MNGGLMGIELGTLQTIKGTIYIVYTVYFRKSIMSHLVSNFSDTKWSHSGSVCLGLTSKIFAVDHVMQREYIALIMHIFTFAQIKTVCFSCFLLSSPASSVLPFPRVPCLHEWNPCHNVSGVFAWASMLNYCHWVPCQTQDASLSLAPQPLYIKRHALTEGRNNTRQCAWLMDENKIPILNIKPSPFLDFRHKTRKSCLLSWHCLSSTESRSTIIKIGNNKTRMHETRVR